MVWCIGYGEGVERMLVTLQLVNGAFACVYESSVVGWGYLHEQYGGMMGMSSTS
jgi:hypothetical protein